MDILDSKHKRWLHFVTIKVHLVMSWNNFKDFDIDIFQKRVFNWISQTCELLIRFGYAVRSRNQVETPAHLLIQNILITCNLSRGFNCSTVPYSSDPVNFIVLQQPSWILLIQLYVFKRGSNTFLLNVTIGVSCFSIRSMSW